MASFLWVGFGGALGAMARYYVSLVANSLLGTTFPFATLIVNVLGSFFMGVFVMYVMKYLPSTEPLRLFLLTGLLGGFTTFSAFSLETYTLWERGDWHSAVIYVFASVVFSISGLIAGVAVSKSLL